MTGKQLIAVSLTCLFILACTGIATKQDPVLQTRDDPTFTVTLVLMSQEAVTAKCASLGAPEMKACNAFHLDKKHCTIYATPQRFAFDTERLETLGHELYHCRFGQWHDPKK